MNVFVIPVFRYGDVPEAPRASVADRMIQRLKSGVQRASSVHFLTVYALPLCIFVTVYSGTSDADNDAQCDTFARHFPSSPPPQAALQVWCH